MKGKKGIWTIYEKGQVLEGPVNQNKDGLTKARS